MPSASPPLWASWLSCIPFSGRGAVTEAAASDLRGHGGPVSALAVAGDVVLSGSFDYRAPSSGMMKRGWRGSSCVSTMAASRQPPCCRMAPMQRAVRTGASRLWKNGCARTVSHHGRTSGPDFKLQPFSDGATLAAASWDGHIQLIDLASGDVATDLMRIREWSPGSLICQTVASSASAVICDSSPGETGAVTAVPACRHRPMPSWRRSLISP